MSLEKFKICVVGLGYVGLPLAVAFAKTKEVVGFDINESRTQDLAKGRDTLGEVSNNTLKISSNLSFTSDLNQTRDCNCYIVTVPTPVDSKNTPDLSPLESASRLVGSVLNSGDFVIYESTVYPGVTEETCIPILESLSGLVLNKNLFCGYSPERINPGDKVNKLENIEKITSGSNSYAAQIINSLYGSIIDAGTHLAPSIKVAEAAKVLENTQRDLNIALTNELAVICDHLNINTKNVIEAASTKWNFHTYYPGLVGGHCIGVDPYYLTFKSEMEGYIPNVILAGRKVNDGMAYYVADRVLRSIPKRADKNNRCLIMGYTFKEDCLDIRNTKVRDLALKLSESLVVDIFDPYLMTEHINMENVTVIDSPVENTYDCIVLAVPHKKIMSMGIKKIKSFGKAKCFIFDLKSAFSSKDVDAQL